MVGRAVVGLVLVLLFSLEGLGRDDESYLVAITIPGSADATQLERLRLPVYHQFEDVLITEVQTVELAILVSSGWKVAVLDENPDAGGYTLLSDQRGTLSADDVGSARILFKHRGGWILKDFDAAVIGVERHGLVAAPLRKTVWRFGAETIVSVAPARADQDSLMAQIVSNVNADTVRFFVQSLQDFGTRYYRSAQADAVADWIKGQFVRMGFTQVEIDSFLFDGTWQKNVIATLPAASPSDEVIVIGGHHDSITGVDPMHYAPGADDNASGTTAVLEIARVLRMMDYHPEVTVKFVTFAAEERGLHGSHDFAEKAVQSGMRIRLMINHDMISYTLSPVESSTLDVNHYSGSAGYRELAKLATQRFTIVGARNGDSNRRNSDSYSFWSRGFPTVYFEEMDLNPYWHKTQDVISNYDMEYCAEVIKASCAMLIASSTKPSEIRNLVVDDRGDGSSLIVQWSEARDFDHSEYRVHVGTASGMYDSVLSTSDTSLVLGGLDQGVAYYVGVSSVDVDGYESFVTEVGGTPYSLPIPPAGLAIEPGWHKVILTWAPNRETDLLGYRIMRATDPAGPSEQLNSGVYTDTSFVDGTAQNGVYYYYSVVAVDSTLHDGQPTQLQKSRVVSLDQGILLVDETKDGDGSPLNPTDAQTDAFYVGLVDGFDLAHHDVADEGGVGLADLGAHSTVIWFGDDVSDMTAPRGAVDDLTKYLEYGGKLLYAGYKPGRAFSGVNPAVQVFAPGDFLHDYLKIRRVEIGLFALFSGSLPVAGGYKDITVDSAKAPSEDHFHLKNIESIFAAPGGGEIFTYDSGFDTTSAFGVLKGKPVGVEYRGQDHSSVVLSFPLYYMEQVEAKALVHHVLLNTFGEATGVEPPLAGLPSRYALHQNYPNPFNPSTTLAFDLPENVRVSARVFDVLGREVAMLLDETMQAGRHRISWDAGGMPSGVYFFRLEAGRFSGTRKLLLVK